MIEACHFLLVHPGAPARFLPLYSAASQGVCHSGHTPTLCSSVVFSLELTFESLKELGVRHLHIWGGVMDMNINKKKTLYQLVCDIHLGIEYSH
jgi:hypothetical protein